jgi:hypothetical protein
MAKEFNKKFMHPTRRKLVDMVLHGKDYETNTTLGWTGEKTQRKVGDIWEDDTYRYEKKEGFILKTSKNSEAFDELRKWRDEQGRCKSPTCNTIKLTPTHKKLIEKTGYCANCLAEIEGKIRIAGLWEQYEDYKIYTRMLVEGKIKLEQLQQAHAEAKQYYEYTNEDGTSEKWELPQPLEEVKAELMEMIEYGKEELIKVEEFRNKAFEILKENNLEHYL